MDSERFDGLVRGLGQRWSRRQTLRGLAGGLAAGVVALSVPEADAARCSRKKRCPECQQCNKRGKCKHKGDGVACSNGTCQKGICDTNCPQPSSDSTYRFSCTGITLTCTADGTLLSATCDGNPTSIIVNDCAGTHYAIANIFGDLTCCAC